MFDSSFRRVKQRTFGTWKSTRVFCILRDGRGSPFRNCSIQSALATNPPQPTYWHHVFVCSFRTDTHYRDAQQWLFFSLPDGRGAATNQQRRTCAQEWHNTHSQYRIWTLKRFARLYLFEFQKCRAGPIFDENAGNPIKIRTNYLPDINLKQGYAICR